MGIFTFLQNALIVITAIVGIKNYKTAKKLQDQGQDILATKTGQGGKIPIIYGRRRVGSTLLYMDTDSGNSKELFIIYGLCLGEVESIELDTIEINGVPLSDTKVFRDGYYTGSDKISSGAGSLNTVSQIGTSSGSFRGDGRSGDDPAKIYRMVFNAHHGADDQAADPMLVASQSSKFTSNHRLRGIAYICASYQYDEKGMFTSVPELTVVVKGKKLYDPRLDGSISGGSGSHRIADSTTYEWSNNAALTLLDYMHQDYGKGLASSLIDLQSFQTAANTADTVVDVPDYSGSYSSATFSADVEDNFITVNEATWKKIKGGELLSVKDSGGTVIINQDDVVDVQRFKPHTESTNYRIYTGTTPPAKVSKSVTFSATNGDATLTVTCTSHGASANDRVLFTGAVSLGGNITATVLNKGYTIATVVDANTFTVEATDLNLDTVLASSSDTGNGGGSAVGKFMYADESGSILAQTRRLQCDGILDTNETVLDNARDLLSNMRGFLNYVDGKYSVLVEDTGSSSFSITDDHIIDEGISIRYEDKADKLNKVVVEFYNAQKKYESDTKTVFHNNSTSTYKNDDGGEELETTAEFQYITNPYNAFNMGKAILERSRRQKTISFIGTPRLLDLTAGDVVSVTYSPYNLSSAAYRVETVNLLDNGLVGIQAIEYFDFYTWSATPPAETVGEDPDTPTGTEVSPPTNLTFTDATSTRRAFLTWTAATNYPAKEFRVIIKNSSGQEIHNRIVSDDFIDLDFIAVANGYVASISSINSVGAESEAASLTFNVTQKPVKLNDIQANAITANEINVTNLAAISADLGSITAGSMNIGSGAFTVSSSGVMTATGATVSGAITASSLNVTGATVTGTLDASVITINGEPLDDAFGVTGTGATRVMSIGFQAQNQLKVTDTGLQYLAISTGGSGIGFEAFSVDGADFTFYSTAAGNSQKETIVNKEGSITLSNLTSAPSGTAQTNSLYLLNGALQFNGSAVATGDITEVVAGTNLNGGGSTGSVTLNLDSTITGNHTFSNNLTVGGDLTVQGTTTTIDTTNLEVKDKNITLNYSTGDSSGNADGAGITIQDAVDASTNATILWDATNDEFDFSHPIKVAGSLGVTNIVTNKVVKFNGTILDDSNITDTGSAITLGSNTTVSGSLDVGTITSTGNLVLNQDSGTIFIGADLDMRILHDGSNGTFRNDTGDLTVDVGGDISLDADGGDVVFKDAGSSIGRLKNVSGNFIIKSEGSDDDLKFLGNDGGSEITALTLDMSAAGAATFNSTISSGAIQVNTDDLTIEGGANASTRGLIIKHTGQTGNQAKLTQDSANGRVILESTERNLRISAGSGGGTGSAETLDFFVNGSERMTIDTSGRVGIGTASPSSLLHCAASGADAKIKVETDGGSDAILELTAPAASGAQSKLMFSDDSASGVGSIVYAHNSGGTDYMTFGTAATERMRIDSSGNLGLGTSSPASVLSVQGDGLQIRLDGTANTSRGLLLRNTGTAEGQIQTDGNMHFIQEDANRYMRFSTANTERMRIDSSGNVILGTTTVASANAAADDFVIKGSGTAVGMTISQDSDSGTGTIFFGDTSSSSAAGFRYNHNTGDMAISAEDNVTFSCDAVGIGTTSPSAPLHVVGNTYVQSGTLFTDAITAYSGSSISINAGSSHLAATVNGSERMRIASNGSIAIGHTSPSSTYILDVNGQIRSFGNSPAFNLREDDSSNQHWQIGSYSGSFAVRNVTGSSYPLTINTSGDATFAGNVTAFSDERLKENIQTLDGKKALQMRGVSFTKDGREGSGVIAQEIEKIAPELVLTADDEQGTKSVAYGNLVGYLIEAIKDQQQQIDKLKAKLDGSS